MDWTQLNSEVQQIVRRPDLVSRIESAVRSAILKIHTTNFYSRDIAELGVEFNAPDTVTNFDPRELFPRFRKIAYIRRWLYDESDSVNLGRPGGVLDHVALGNVLDYYGFPKTEIYYEAGELLQIKTALPLDYALVGVYQFPDMNEQTFDSWIARDYPYAIVYEAAAKIFGQIGNTAQQSAMLDEAKDQIVILQMQATEQPTTSGGGYAK